MVLSRSNRRLTFVFGGVSLASLTLALIGGARAADPVSITLLAGGNDPTAIKFSKDLTDKFMAANPGIKVEFETRLGGTDGDN